LLVALKSRYGRAEEIAPDLRFSGEPFDPGGPPGEDYWDVISERLLGVMPAT